ncbi:MAG: hypothetical protein V3R84_01590 [Acidimicrobiia bacterium]
MFSSMIIEPDVDERVFQDVKLPPIKRPDKRRPRLVRWLQWLVTIAVVVGVATAGYFLLRDDSSPVVNADPFGIRYRETREALISDALLADPFGTRLREAGVVIPDVNAPAAVVAPASLYDSWQSLHSTAMLPAGPDLVEVAHLTALTDIYLARVSPSAPDLGEFIRPIPGRYGGPL